MRQARPDLLSVGSRPSVTPTSTASCKGTTANGASPTAVEPHHEGSQILDQDPGRPPLWRHIEAGIAQGAGPFIGRFVSTQDAEARRAAVAEAGNAGRWMKQNAPMIETAAGKGVAAVVGAIIPRDARDVEAG